VEEIRELGRATQGVTLIALDAKAKLIQVQPVVEEETEDDVPPEADAVSDAAAE